MPLDTTKQTSTFGGVKDTLTNAIQAVENEIQRLGNLRKELQSALAHTEDAEAAFTTQAQYMTGNLMRTQPPIPVAETYKAPPFPVPPSPPSTQFVPTRDGDDKRAEDSALKALDAAFAQPAPVAKAKS